MSNTNFPLLLKFALKLKGESVNGKSGQGVSKEGTKHKTDNISIPFNIIKTGVEKLQNIAGQIIFVCIIFIGETVVLLPEPPTRVLLKLYI